MLRHLSAAAFAAALSCPVILSCPVAHANDSTATLGLGGLVYTGSSNIRMAEEDLFLSRDAVTVRYRFENTGDEDVSTLVAFPLPDFVIGDEINYSLPDSASGDPVNFIDFSVTVDGQPVPVSVDARATRFGVDVTDILARHDIPVTLIGGNALYDRLNDMSATERQDLVENGLVDWTTTFGANHKPLANAHWTAHVAFYWHQTFPAHRPIIVEHRYKPVPGVFFMSEYELKDADFARKYCIDKGFARAVKRKLGPDNHSILHGYDLSYVLTTANNWMGSIGRFSLTIDKGDKNDLVSLCGEDIEKIGPTTFRLEKTDYAPSNDISVLFVTQPAN